LKKKITEVNSSVNQSLKQAAGKGLEERVNKWRVCLGRDKVKSI